MLTWLAVVALWGSLRLAELPDIVVATPSRLVAHLADKAVSLAQLKLLVIDEADLILSYGYAQDVQTLLGQLAKRCQTLLMSATLNHAVLGLKQLVLHNPAVLKLDESKQATASLDEYSIRCTEADKFLICYALIRLKIIPGKAIFFVNSVDGCYKLKLLLERFSIRAAVLNAQLPAASRLHIVQSFNRHLFDYLIASDESLAADTDSDSDADGPDADAQADDDDDSDGEDGQDDEQQQQSDSDDDDADDGSSSSESSSAEAAAADDASSDESAAAVAAAAGDKRKRSSSSSLPAKRRAQQQLQTQQQPASGNTASRKASTKPVDPVAPSKHAKTGKGGKGGKGGDSEYGVARGIDFKAVTTVVNFDVPHSLRAYVHRVGRTARGGDKGTALTLVSDADADLLEAISVKRVEQGSCGGIKPYTFHLKLIDAFRYRVDDMLRSVTRAAVKQARLKELKTEIINSDKLKTHFEENPRELQLLKHDKTLQQNKVKPHLKFIPTYLVPAALQQQTQNGSSSSSRGGQRSSRGSASKRKGGKNDPLKSFKVASSSRANDDDALLHRKRNPSARGRRGRRRPYDPSQPAM
eukprot:TRINITY_DN1800_c0_g1_i2.p1 TRINITY_DN1800_c0_g1~~TRINITY_DN1800_c0_g1_i2.p1  ORF type:complete len:584 (-),score=270.38 TRINITY_DN1800_c0_g1_i2:2909-4660(-)